MKQDLDISLDTRTVRLLSKLPFRSSQDGNRVHFVRCTQSTGPRFPANVFQILRLLDNSRHRHLSFPISPPQIIEDTHYFDRCPRDMDLLDMDSVDCGRGVSECRYSIYDGKQPMHTCVLWPAKGVVR